MLSFVWESLEYSPDLLAGFVGRTAVTGNEYKGKEKGARRERGRTDKRQGAYQYFFFPTSSPDCVKFKVVVV